MTTTWPRCMSHHDMATSKLHVYCSSTARTFSHWITTTRPCCILRQKVATPKLYVYCSSMVRTLMHWVMTTRLHSIWHHNTVESEPHIYYSIMAQMSISRTTMAIPPPKLRRQGHEEIAGLLSEHSQSEQNM